MPKSVASYRSIANEADAFDDDDGTRTPRSSRGFPSTPSTMRRHGSLRASDWDLKSRLPSRRILDDHAALLDNTDGRPSYRAVASAPVSPRKTFKRRNSAPSGSKQNKTLGSRVAKALGTEANVVEGRLVLFSMSGHL